MVFEESDRLKSIRFRRRAYPLMFLHTGKALHRIVRSGEQDRQEEREAGTHSRGVSAAPSRGNKRVERRQHQPLVQGNRENRLK